ncbi:SdpI family protein [Humibacter sp.]|uniref:SdpI family protein n=1 Tax=Humibacter sp. TaxID=1940291 RepID=UPI002C1CB42E|nr:SdpI family protein [Humibacter sp.]HVX08447.1 SdpI family protein [Humibacter sp.]
MIIGAAVVGILSIAVVVLIPLCATGRIPRNPFIGLRLPAFFASEDAWKAGHRAAVPSSVVGAVVALVACVLAIALPSTAGVWLTVAVVALLAGLVVGAVLGTRAARRVSSPSDLGR